MSDERLEGLLKESFREIKRLRSRLKYPSESQPIAVVGMACRAPGGVHSLEDYWRVLTSHQDVIGPCPDRWSGIKFSHRARGGFLEQAEWFDPDFFGISPREAIAMEPQHRLALELAWEALESAGLPPRSLAGSNTGVFLGAASSEYGWWAQPQESEGYQLTGLDTSVLSGRIAFHFDLRGPTLTVNTACSSSLVSLHLAAQALRNRECDMALVGGVCVMCHPGVFSEFECLDGLAPDGRCKSFSAKADGVGWSEGAGLLVLKRVQEVKPDDHVWGLIRGSAINQDGRTLSLTAPNGPSQQRVIKLALERSELDPNDLDAVEAHGTGTRLGDPIEAEALRAVYGLARGVGQPPLWVGSAKSHLGHTQAAAGILGVIKMLLALEYETLPPTLHCDTPTPSVSWQDSGLGLLAQARPWQRHSSRVRRAAVSSFGMSGTNTHLVVEESADHKSLQVTTIASWPLLLSAHSPAALRAQAQNWYDWLQQHAPPWEATLRTAMARTELRYRAAITADDQRTALEPLAALAQGFENPRLETGQAHKRGQRIVFVFSGHGGQWPGMGQELLNTSVLFRDTIERCDNALRAHQDWSVLEVFENWDKPHPGGVRQVTLFALGLGLAELWRSWGLEPTAVVGHSLGEITAATVAGALSLEEGARLIALRARLIKPLCGLDFGMLALPLGQQATLQHLVSFAELEIAAVNSASSTVVSGPGSALRALKEHLQGEQTPSWEVEVDWACHSAQLDPVLESFRDLLGEVKTRPPQLPMLSTVNGEWVEHETLDTDYWVRNLRQPVRLDHALKELSRDHDLFLEIGPHPVLTRALTEACPGAICGHSMQRDKGSLLQLYDQITRFYLQGLPITWERVAGLSHPPVALPPYPFQRQRYWLPHPVPGITHPLLHRVQATPEGGWCLQGVLDPHTQPWLQEHSYQGEALFPATAFLELCLAVSHWLSSDSPMTCRQLHLESPITLHEPVPLRIWVTPSEHGYAITLESRQGDDWKVRARARLRPQSEPLSPLPSWPPENAVRLDFDPTSFYLTLNKGDLHLGPAFRGLGKVWSDSRQPHTLWLEASLAEDVPTWGLHPALLDSALQGVGLLNPTRSRVPLPSQIAVGWSGTQTVHRLRMCLELLEEDSRGYRARAHCWDQDNQPVLLLERYEAIIAPREGPRLMQIRAIPGPSDPWPALTWSRLESGLLLGDAGLDLTDHGLTSLELCCALLTTLQSKLPDSLTVLTKGAIAWDSGEAVSDIAGAAAWGLLRSLGREHPELGLCLLDIDSHQDSQKLLGRGPAGEFLLRQGQRWTRSLTALPPEPTSTSRLEPSPTGQLQSLAFHPSPALTRELSGTEVRLQIRAIGLNFRDVLRALNAYPGAPNPLGAEAAGVVLEVGPQVRQLRPGQAVVGFTPEGGFAAQTITLEDLLIPLPTGLTFAQAATLPVAYVTAYWCLKELVPIQPGQKILIHAVSGGVGMAARKLAELWGAEVYGTASRWKWPSLCLPNTRLSDSRSLNFACEVMEQTRGQGVDIVLNSLKGEFAEASLRCLKPGGHFLELGRTEQPQGQLSYHYHQVDLEGLSGARVQEMLRHISPLIPSQQLDPLPLTGYPLSRVTEAFSSMASAQHQGKLVTLPAPPALQGTVLITGGSGGLGRLLARHLVQHHGVRSLILVSRRGSNAPEARELQTTLESLARGVEIRVEICDLGDREALAQLLESISPDQPLGAVFHLAGELADATFSAQTPQMLERALSAKLDGALHLDELTRPLNSLTHFVLFSAASGLLSGAGQAGYAAANAGLNALARQRQACGLPALSLVWGPWNRVGMTVQLSDGHMRRLSASQIPPLEPEEALELLDEALKVSLPVVVAADWKQAEEVDPIQHQEPDLLQLVRREVARVLRLPGPQAVEPQRPLRDLGLDSLTAVELRNQLMARLGRKLPTTLVFDYPDPRALAAYLADQLPTEEASSQAPPQDSPVAIIGLACRAPGGVDSPEDYWRLLVRGEDAIQPISCRWPQWPGSQKVLGGLMHDIERFEPTFFGVSPREASTMSPEQRLCLEVSWEALERAGFPPAKLGGSKTGVYLGASRSDYGADQPLAERTVMGRAASAVSGRLSYLLNLQGPCLSVDTACSSSLVALHLACQGLLGGECDLALAGGVSVMNTPATFVAFEQMGASSGDGRCKPFSREADGTTWSEGVAVLVLKPLHKAQQNNDRVLAIIRGSALNQDGKTQGFTAPNGPSQERVVRQALRRAGLTPHDIDVVEAHGTGTALGDPIEACALARVFGPGRNAKAPLWLGSVKANIGHTQAAAGALGVVKMVLAILHRRLPRSPHSEQPTTHLEWKTSGLSLLQQAQLWEPGERIRRAGVSSFGMSGTNGHLILEQPPAAKPSEGQLAKLPLVISAGSSEGLRRQARRWKSWIEGHPEEPWYDILHTAALRRTHYPYYAWLHCESRNEAMSLLEFLALDRPHPLVVRGQTADNPTEVNWGELAQGYLGTPCALPPYPFEGQRYGPNGMICEGQLYRLTQTPLPWPEQLSPWCQADLTRHEPEGTHLVLDLRKEKEEPLSLASRTLTWLQNWLVSNPKQALTIVTHRASGESGSDLGAALVWGLVRSLQRERPERKIQLLDSDGSRPLEHLVGPELPPEGLVRQGGLNRLELRPHQDSSPGPTLRDSARANQGTVLITGATGDLGRLLTRHLALKHEIRHFLLLSRRGAQAPGALAWVESLRQDLGLQAQLIACDVGSETALANAMAMIPSAHPLVGVFHLAATLRDGVFSNQTPDTLESVLTTKFQAALHLDRMTSRCDTLTHFVLFSSTAGTLGGPGAANYAAACAALDALAWKRQEKGLPGLSIAWTQWEKLGLAEGARNWTRRMTNSGLLGLAPERALELLDQAMLGKAPVVAAVRFQSEPTTDEPETAGFADRLETLTSRERLDSIKQHLHRVLGRILGYPPQEKIPERKGFFELGLDSLMALELRDALQGSLNRELSVTLAFEFPNIEALAEALARTHSPQPEARAESSPGVWASSQLSLAEELSRLESLLKELP